MRLLKLLFSVILVAGAVRLAMAFSLLGPFATWQTAVYDGFTLNYDRQQLGGGSVDIGGPKSVPEGYRWNVPVVTYAFDQSFIYYFGSNGMAAAEAAIKVLNDLPESALITNDGNSLYINGERVPTDTARVNYLAQGLGLLDVKSTALHALLEEIGLAEPERFAWTLLGRNVDTIAGENFTNYTVGHYNFDPITLMPSPVVNGILYTYNIFESLNPNVSDAVESPVDPLGVLPFSSVAGSIPASGHFFTGLTHDDVGGIRWLYNTNNMAVETLLTTVAPGRPVLGAGGSPWGTFFSISNFFTGSSNAFILTNLNLTNLFGTNATNFLTPKLRPGANKLHFQRVNYDSLLGQTFVPITNRYTDTVISNSQILITPVERTLNQPDIIFTAGRLGLFDNLSPVLFRRTSTTNWVNNDAVNGEDPEVDGGPGVISPPVIFYFSDQLPYFVNETPFFLNEATAGRSAVWASFDGSTNAPIIYPAYGDVTVDKLRIWLGLP